MTDSPALPPYTIQENPRAKRVILKVLPRQGVVVVIPKDFSRNKVAAIVAEKQEWLARALQKVGAQGPTAPTVQELPTVIQLPAIPLKVAVFYANTGGLSLRLAQTGPERLVLTGNCADSQGCQELLRRWLKVQGQRYLLPWLKKISEETRLLYRQARIRGQKSRWGSCSAQGNINLNYNLLFLRPQLVRYILLHELCHTVQLNHSLQFYQLLARFEPNHRDLRMEMKQSWRQVPWWAI